MDGESTPYRIGRQDGFGLVELLIAMTILAVGITAVVAGFSAGALSLQRASKTSTAGTVADAQMELYRGLRYSAIALDPVAIASAPANYSTDRACGTPPACSAADQITGSTACAPLTREACPTRAVTGADGDSYRVDVYIKWSCALGTLDTAPAIPDCKTGATVVARAAKLVTISVRDGRNLSKTLFRESSTFERALG